MVHMLALSDYRWQGIFCTLFEGLTEKGRRRIAQEQEEEGPGLRGDKRTEKRREVALTRGRRGAINYVTQ